MIALSAAYLRKMVGDLVGLAVVVLIVPTCIVVSLYILRGCRSWAVPNPLVRVWSRWRRRPEAPTTRPIEDIAVLARRLSRRFHEPPQGQRFVKAEGLRRAYDGVLAEACSQLAIVNLLGVLEAGSDLDRERARVEWALECAGMELGLPL